MLNLYDYYLKLKEEDVIFSYRGKITGELMEGIYRMMDVQDSASRADDVKKKKLNYLLVECCQNVIKHSVKGEDDSILVIARNEEDSYLIYTGNIIEKLEVSEIENKINEINLMSADELREFYRLKLDRNQLSGKGGAGLGLIEMARKSGNKIAFSFSEASDGFVFFSLTVTIK